MCEVKLTELKAKINSLLHLMTSTPLSQQLMKPLDRTSVRIQTNSAVLPASMI